MEIADSITVRYLSLAILFANAAPPLLLFAWLSLASRSRPWIRPALTRSPSGSRRAH